MQEALLQYIWKYTLFCKKTYRSDTRELVEIISSGSHNADCGPDFLNARARINGTEWAGNAEIHLRSSDWYRHKHHLDPAYNNVIIHAVLVDDKPCYNSAGRRVSTIVLNIKKGIEKKYKALIESDKAIPCEESLYKLDKTLITFWLSSLSIERLEGKLNSVQEYLKICRNSWEEAFYISLARGFGLKVNALPFELLAKSINYNIVNRHKQSLPLIEALFFGQAGFLQQESGDEYYLFLKNEYTYLTKKYKLTPIEMHIWKFMRLRPYNFPTVRIAQFCALLHNSSNLFSDVICCKNAAELSKLFYFEISDYWKSHYHFNKPSSAKINSPGRTMTELIIINSVIPFLWLYGENKNNILLKERSIRMLEEFPPENNSITRRWSKNKIHAKNTAESQALIQLTTNYCNKKRCLECQIGHLILNQE